MLQPVQVARELPGDIALSPSWEADHHNDQLGADIASGDASIGRDFGLGEAGNIEGGGVNTVGRGRWDGIR